MSTPRPALASGLLVVEGQNDLHLVRHLARGDGSAGALDFEFHDAQGVDRLLASVRGFVNQNDYKNVGFLADADADATERWRQIITRISRANADIGLPPSPSPDGTIIPEDPVAQSPRIGIWIMPDNESVGELEDFAAQMIPSSDPVWPLAQAYIDNIPPEARKFDDSAIVKAHVHAWPAARRRTGLIGRAVSDGDLNVEGQLTQRFLAWLSRLFA